MARTGRGAKEMTTTKEQPINSKHWTEDYSHENGCYTNRCIDCGDEFCGHKRRVVCKLCDRLARLTAERDAYKAALGELTFSAERVLAGIVVPEPLYSALKSQ